MNWAGVYRAWVLGRPWPFVLCILAVAVALGSRLPDFKLDAGTSTLTLEGDDSKRVYDQTRELFTDDDYLLIAIRPPGVAAGEPWTADQVQLVVDLTADLEALEGVTTVLSPTNVPLLTAGPGPMQQVTLADEGVDLAKAYAELTTSEVYRNQLAAADGTAFNLAAYFDGAGEDARTRMRELQDELAASGSKDPDTLAEIERLASEVLANRERDRSLHRRLVETIRADVLPKYRDLGAEIHASGLPTLVVDMVDYLEHDIVWFGGAVTLFMIGALFVFFRRPRFVFLPLATCLITVVSVMGLTVVAGVETTVVTSNMSSLLFIIGMAHSIHLVVRYREERAREPDREYLDTLQSSVAHIVRPCLYTALTTAVGFGSLAVTDVAPVQDFALFMSIGVVWAFVVSMLFLPAALALLPPTEEELRDDSNGRHPLLALAARIARERRGLVYGTTVVLLGLSVWGISRITVDTRFVDYFRSDTEVHQGIEFIDQVGGTMTLEVILPGDRPDQWLEEDQYAKVRAVHDYFETVPQVGKTLSLVSFREHMKLVAPFTERMPYKTIVALMRRQLGQERVDGLLGLVANSDVSTTRVYVRLKETSEVLDRDQILADLDRFLAEEPTLEDQETTVTGMFLLFTNMLDTLVGSQVKSFLWVFVAVGVMFALLLRHVGAALVAMPANLLPIAIVLGTMGFAGITLDLMTIMIASVSLGIAADATIHYLVRFRSEARGAGSLEECVPRAHQSIGRAILYTALTVFVGFFVLVLSKFTPTIYFGLLIGIAMVAGLLADLVLLPANMLTARLFRGELRDDADDDAEDDPSAQA